ncbi:MAG TPA: hypothetical protein VHA52_12930, partial [Candidatus Babeliaceae bacterium]|nr:hypothetical protein [Candidatus Babeliaceae bacterium]
MADTHIFALYTEARDLAHIANSQTVEIVDQSVIHRVTNVLRLRYSDQFLLFNNHMLYRVKISKVLPKSIVVTVEQACPLSPLLPTI